MKYQMYRFFNRKHILFLSFLSTFSAFGQEVISTQGDSYSVGNVSMDLTIGEPIIFTATDGNSILTQGFHQTNWNFLELEDHFQDIDVSVYPNPIQQHLIIETARYDEIKYEFHDASGRLVLSGELDGAKTTLLVGQLAPGQYHLTALSHGQVLKTFKLQKTQ